MWCKILLCALLCHFGHSVRIVSVGRTMNVDTQETREITLDCEVQLQGQESLLSNHVYWFKVQNLTVLEIFTSQSIISAKLNQDTTISEGLERAVDDAKQISSLLQLQNPFDDSNRFSVRNIDSGNRNVISLQISRLQTQDSGTYICAVKQSGNMPVLTTDYQVNILQKGLDVMLMGSPDARNHTNMMGMNSGSPSLIYHENMDGYFECRSEGGYPAPHLSVFIGEQRMSGFGLNEEYTNYTLFGDLGGLQNIIPIRWINSTNFRVNREMNDQRVRCQAEIRSGDRTLQNVTAEKTLVVYYRPIVDCKEKEIRIPLGGAKIPVKCNIHARPTPEVTWTAKSNNVKVKSNDNTPNNLGLKAVSTVSTSDDTMEATLTFDEVRNVHFQQYDITAENVVGRSYITVTIKHGKLSVRTDNSASTLSSMVLTLFVAALQVIKLIL